MGSSMRVRSCGRNARAAQQQRRHRWRLGHRPLSMGDWMGLRHRRKPLLPNCGQTKLVLQSTSSSVLQRGDQRRAAL